MHTYTLISNREQNKYKTLIPTGKPDKICLVTDPWWLNGPNLNIWYTWNNLII